MGHCPRPGEQIQVMNSHGGGDLQAPLTKRRSPTALAEQRKRHLETRGFEDPYGSRPMWGSWYRTKVSSQSTTLPRLPEEASGVG
jgi:hypothetical protein